MTDIRHPARSIAPDVLAQLGEGLVGYVRRMKSEDFRRLFPGGPELPEGELFALFGATGQPILVSDAQEIALAGAIDHDLVPVTLH